jgi:uncharacterized membrane protein
MEFGYFQALLVVHLLTVVVGIGSVMLNGVYGAQAKKAGPNGGNAIVRANFEVTKIAEIFIYLTPVTGILLVIKNEAYDFSDTWVWSSIVLYVLAVGNAHMNLLPGAKKMIELTQGPPDARDGDVGQAARDRRDDERPHRRRPPRADGLAARDVLARGL